MLIGKASVLRDLGVRSFEVRGPAEITNKAMQGGNRRQNRRNHPKKPEDPAFRREVRFGDRDGHRGEIQREQIFFWVISCHFQINVSVGCSWHMLYLHCELDGSWMALAPHKRPRHGGLPRCHPKFQEARFKKPVPQGEHYTSA